jgi:16S rRNA (uracil1498-N3)-methyltransferase
MAERFYINCPLAPGQAVLSGPEAHHIAVVCRLRQGDPLCLFNGDGREYPARILAVERRRAVLEVLEARQPQRELGFRLEVAAPLPKGDRTQFLIEKLTEMGVASFVPLQTRRSVIQPREARLEKLQRYVIEASKQCGRNVLMRIAEPASWEDYCGRGELVELKAFGHPGGLAVADFRTRCALARAVTVAVGPEGGFAEEEVAMACTAGWRPLDLGPRILRIETAALLMTAWATAGSDHLICQDSGGASSVSPRRSGA